MALSKKQQAFVESYLTCWNAAEAARLAGYSEKTARQQGSRLLTNVDIQAAIQERLNELKMGADEVLVRLTDIARGSMDHFVTGSGGVSLSRARDAKKMHLIKRLTYTVSDKGDQRTEHATIELYSAQDALVQIGRAHGLFVDRTESKIEHEYPTDEQHDRAVTALAEALGDLLSPAGDGANGALDAAE